METVKENSVTGTGEKPRRVIKRYSNRKLYDTKDSRYVTLQQIGEMVRAGEEVQIIDNATKEDKTEVTLALIMIDKIFGVRATIEAAIPILRTSWSSEIVTQTMVPTTIMWAVSVLLYIIIAPYRPTVREVMIAYFTAFAVAWVLMAILGSAFRGQAMQLYLPWDPGMTRIP